MESTALKLWRFQIIPGKCICNSESKFCKIHQPLLNKNLKHYYLGVAFLIWGLLSSKIQFFNEKEENIESSVYIFKVLVIFSNLNSASFREGSRISVKEVWGKKSIQILHKNTNLKHILWYEIPHSLSPRAHNERHILTLKYHFSYQRLYVRKLILKGK